MQEIDSKEFVRHYTVVRHVYEPLVGGWDLYKHKLSGDKILVKEIKFYTESDRDEYMPRITECPIYQTTKDNGFLKCLGTCRRNANNPDEGACYLLLVMFEFYETTFEKVLLKKIKDSDSFTVRDILKVLQRLASSLEILERNDLTFGDVRSGNIAITPDGKMKLVWTPFNKTGLELMTDKMNPNLVKVINPSPELIEAYNETNFTGGGLSMYNDMGANISYTRNDVYSLGILVLKMSNLYSSEPFYMYGSSMKVNTKKIETGILKLHSLSHRLGTALNNMLCYDPMDRWSFAMIVESLDSKTEPVQTELIPGLVRGTPKSPIHQKTPSQGNINRSLVNNFGQELHNQDPQGEYEGGMNSARSNRDLQDGTFADDFGGTIQLVPGGLGSTGNLQTIRNVGSPLRPSKSQGVIDEMPTISPQKRPTSPITQSSTKLGTQKPKTPAVPMNLFLQRGLAELKTELISSLEQTIFFDGHARLRAGIKIRETAGSKYVGEMFCGKRSGLGVFYHQNGDVCVGRWNQGAMSGDCVYLYADGSVYLGNARDGKKDGFGRLLHANGDVYEGDWTRNKKNGKGLYYYYMNETIYEGSWVLNYKEGWGTYYNKDGEWIEGEWRANNLIRKLSQGVDDSFPQVKNLLQFYTNQNDWDELVYKLQSLLEKRVDENYNYVDPKQYEDIPQIIARERSPAPSAQMNSDRIEYGMKKLEIPIPDMRASSAMTSQSRPATDRIKPNFGSQESMDIQSRKSERSAKQSQQGTGASGPRAAAFDSFNFRK